MTTCYVLHIGPMLPIKMYKPQPSGNLQPNGRDRFNQGSIRNTLMFSTAKEYFSVLRKWRSETQFNVKSL